MNIVRGGGGEKREILSLLGKNINAKWHTWFILGLPLETRILDSQDASYFPLLQTLI